MDVLCTNCKWSSFDDYSKQMVCNHANNFVEYFDQQKYFITGVKENPRMVRRGATVDSLRIDRGAFINSTTCGPDAKWFEQKVEQ